jgi:PTS system fructose-specific IIC component
MEERMKTGLTQIKQYLLTGVSYVVPLIACGGILIALSLAYAFRFLPPAPDGGPNLANAPLFVQGMFTIGESAFKLFPAVLAGFIAYGMAGKPGLVPGLVGGFIAGMPQTVAGKSTSAGFLGALLIGLAAGAVVNALKKVAVPRLVKPVMPIIVIPILSALAVGLLMLALNLPLARVMIGLGHFLEGLQSGSQIVLAMVLGAMIAFDMGGPVNKAAFFFGAAMIQQGNYAVMGACAAAICTPP